MEIRKLCKLNYYLYHHQKCEFYSIEITLLLVFLILWGCFCWWISCYRFFVVVVWTISSYLPANLNRAWALLTSTLKTRILHVISNWKRQNSNSFPISKIPSNLTKNNTSTRTISSKTNASTNNNQLIPNRHQKSQLPSNSSRNKNNENRSPPHHQSIPECTVVKQTPHH